MTSIIRNIALVVVTIITATVISTAAFGKWSYNYAAHDWAMWNNQGHLVESIVAYDATTDTASFTIGDGQGRTADVVLTDVSMRGMNELEIEYKEGTVIFEHGRPVLVSGNRSYNVPAQNPAETFFVLTKQALIRAMHQ